MTELAKSESGDEPRQCALPRLQFSESHEYHGSNSNASKLFQESLRSYGPPKKKDIRRSTVANAPAFAVTTRITSRGETAKVNGHHSQTSSSIGNGYRRSETMPLNRTVPPVAETALTSNPPPTSTPPSVQDAPEESLLSI